jgi:hypothetical protein
MAVIEFVRVVVVGSKLEVARDVPWRKGNCSRIRLSTTSKRLSHQDRPFVHKYLSAEIFNNPHNGTMKHNHLVINEKTVYQKFLIRFLQNVTPWKQASQEIPHVTDCISDKVLQDMFVERGFAEQLLNSISQRENPQGIRHQTADLNFRPAGVPPPFSWQSDENRAGMQARSRSFWPLPTRR